MYGFDLSCKAGGYKYGQQISCFHRRCITVLRQYAGGSDDMS